MKKEEGYKVRSHIRNTKLNIMTKVPNEEQSNNANVLLPTVFVGYDKEGNEILSNECKPKKKCGDSDWWFDKRSKMFRRYYTYHDELNGLQTVYEQCVGVPKNGR